MMAEDPALDANVVSTLRGLQQPGGGSVLDELIDMFLSDSRTRMDELRRFIGQGDHASARVQAHTLKGSSGSLGATPMSRLCGRVEAGAANPGTEDLETLFADLEGEYARVRTALEAERSG